MLGHIGSSLWHMVIRSEASNIILRGMELYGSHYFISPRTYIRCSEFLPAISESLHENSEY